MGFVDSSAIQGDGSGHTFGCSTARWLGCTGSSRPHEEGCRRGASPPGRGVGTGCAGRGARDAPGANVEPRQSKKLPVK